MGGIWILIALVSSFINGTVAFYFVTHSIWVDLILVLFTFVCWLRYRHNDKRRRACQVEVDKIVVAIQGQHDDHLARVAQVREYAIARHSIRPPRNPHLDDIDTTDLDATLK